MLVLPKKDKSLWREFSPGNSYPELMEDRECDVVVIGAGIAGLSAAYYIKKAGKKVIVLEQKTIGNGTTGRTTGKVTSQHGLIYEELINSHGQKKASDYAAINQLAVEEVAKIIKSEKINCDWQRTNHSIFTASTQKISKFKQEFKAVNTLGLPASYEVNETLPFKIGAAIKFNNQGKLNSQRYLMGLAKSIVGNGSYIFENSQVIIIRGGRSCLVKTKHATIKAKDIIVATHVPTFPLAARFTYASLEYPTESYLVAAKTKKLFKGTYISPDDNHYSIFPIRLSNQNYILIGAEGGNIPGLRISKVKRYRKLADYAEKFFGAYEVTYKWSDMDYQAYDSLPLIGRLYPWSRHIYVATGFQKWGLSNGTAAGIIIRDLILNGNSKWADTFNPHRLGPIKNIPRVAVKQFFG